MPLGRLTGKSITWTAPACGRISTQPGQKGGGRSGAGPFPGRFRDQNPSEGRGSGQAGGLLADPRSTAEASVFGKLMAQGEVKRSGRGRPRIKPRRVCGDKGYSSRRIRAYLRQRGIRYTIPRKTNERRTGPFNRSLYRQRNLVERTINRLKQFRRIATRYEKRAENYLAMLQIGSLMLWL